jgi:hypothetical protein
MDRPLSTAVRLRISELLEELCCDLEIPCNTNFPFKDDRACVLHKALTAAARYADEQARTPRPRV